jgi:5-methylthioadenosine/S-adenosylhomocysteine deaminase
MSVVAIRNAIIYTVDAEFTVYRSGTLIFDQQQIIAIGHSTDIVIPDDAEIIEGEGKLAVLPGLIDTHSHSSLLKGFTENAQLMDWLPEYQREHQVLNQQDAYFACLISYLEALKGGTTTVLDMYRFLHKGAEAADLLGMRAHLVPYAADHPDKPFFETLETSQALIEQFHNTSNGKIKTWLGLEHITYCSEAMFRQVRDLSDHYGVSIHTHTSEQQEEVEAVKQLFGDRPVHKFNDWGILKPGTVLAHGVWLDDKEIQVIADSGTGIAHCPISNMKLAGGVAPLDKFEQAGITVGLGSDGAICNNSLSLFECMKTASLLQKVHYLDATAINAEQALRMATIDGAKLLGVDSEIGSLEVGKQADLLTLDLWQPHLLPIEPSEDSDPVMWNIVFAARASDVKQVWVQGQQVIHDGRACLIDEHEVMQAVHDQTKDMLNRRSKITAIPMV